MRKTIWAITLASAGLAFGSSSRNPADVDGGFNFPTVGKEHVHMQQLLENAMGYINPEHGLIDEASGYPVEGWNHDPSKGLYLRSFTQLTSIGEWLELLGDIAAGYAVNPYISREEALAKLEHATESLLADQADPTVSAKGLLGNFLGLENGKRLGPLVGRRWSITAGLFRSAKAPRRRSSASANTARNTSPERWSRFRTMPRSTRSWGCSTSAS